MRWPSTLFRAFVSLVHWSFLVKPAAGLINYLHRMAASRKGKKVKAVVVNAPMQLRSEQRSSGSSRIPVLFLLSFSCAIFHVCKCRFPSPSHLRALVVLCANPIFQTGASSCLTAIASMCFSCSLSCAAAIPILQSSCLANPHPSLLRRLLLSCTIHFFSSILLSLPIFMCHCVVALIEALDFYSFACMLLWIISHLT